MRILTKQKKSIRRKITLLICVTGLVVITSGISLGYFWGFSLLKKIVVEHHETIAQILSVSVEGTIDKQIEDIEAYVSDVLWQSAIRESNLKYEAMGNKAIKEYLLQMDKQWIEAPENSSLVREFLERDVSIELRELIKKKEDAVEIFLTNKFGGLVGASGKTTDFYQADEKWWQEAFAAGKGKIFIGDFEFDESSNAWSIPIAVPIKDNNNDLSGICKVVIDVNMFFMPLRNFKLGRTGQVSMVVKKGYVMYHPDFHPLTKRIFTEEDYLKSVMTKSKSMIIDSPYGEKKKVFVVLERVNHPLLLANNIVWRICVMQDRKEIFAPLNKLMFHAGVLTIILLIILILTGYIFGGGFVKPIKKLHEATEKIAKGNLEYKIEINTNDEIEQLADAFNVMTRDLKKTTVSIDNLNAEVAERRKREKELEEAKKAAEIANHAKSDFLANMSHELRTPLNAIIGFSEVLRDEGFGKVNEKQREYIIDILDSGKHLHSLINDLLDLSKIESGKVKLYLTEVNFKELIENSVVMIKEKALKHGIKISVDIKDNVENIRADERSIKQVIYNLLSNAVKFTPDGGDVGIEAQQTDKELLVTVWDTGIGIEDKDKNKIFKAFEQIDSGISRQYEGTGLGLALSKKIVELHGGRIWFESEGENRGAKFNFTIPWYKQ
ncbi:MAG: ATP-binding protein [Candidatus Omnitrophota bacterium]